jgi:hypothetical protein
MAIKHFCLSILLLTSCASNSQTVEPKDPTSLSVCEVTSNLAQYVGKELTLRASYMSDHRHGEVFWDPSCRGKAILGGYEVENRDPSVDAFYNSDSKSCKRPLACPAVAEVVVKGTLQKDEDGLYLNLTKVLHANIIE